MSELSEMDQRLISNIDEFGCHILWVFDPDGEDLDFAYSIGFETTLGQPDVLISGLPSSTSKSLINDTLALCREGFELFDFARTDRLIDGYDCVFRSIREDSLPDYFGTAFWYYRTQTDLLMTRAVQMVWPDRSGTFPWEDSFDESFRAEQDELWEREEVH
ncbi:MAG: DUF4262 domain-containing protein [Erythrobacter sp.]|nr:DUF4262 domain-containing protein [Erythrobacter sp.]